MSARHNFNLALLKWAVVPIAVFLLAGLATRQVRRMARERDAATFESSMAAARSLVESGDRAQALNSLHTAAACVADDPRQLMELARSFKELGNNDSALEWQLKAMLHIPDDEAPVAYAKAVERFLEDGNEVGVQRVMEEHLLVRWPEHWVTKFIQGVIALDEATNRDGVEEALQHFQRSVELNGDHLPSRTQLGIAYWRLGHLDNAEPLLRSVVKAEPANLPALFHLGEVLRRQGKTEEAQQFLSEHERITELHARKQHLQVQYALETHQPGDVLELGRIHAELGDFRQAEATLGTYTRLAPDDPEGHRELAWVRERTGDADGAGAAAEMANALSSRGDE